MRFIHKWAYSCAKFLTKQLNENHEKRRVYYFGFQVIIGGIIKVISLVLIALILRTLIPTLIILLVFGSLRMIAGGFHMDTYGKCIATSLALFILAGVIVQYTYSNWNQYVICLFVLLSVIISLISAKKWAPSDTPNRPITKPEEITKFKNGTYLYIFIWLIVISILFITRVSKYQVFVLAATFGLILEIFTITPLGHKFFNRISGKIQK